MVDTELRLSTSSDTAQGIRKESLLSFLFSDEDIYSCNTSQPYSEINKANTTFEMLENCLATNNQDLFIDLSYTS